jgi:hypothetical protein
LAVLGWIGQRCLDFRAGVQGSQNRQRSDGGARQIGRYIGGNTDQAEHVQIECLPLGAHGFEVGARIVAQSEIERVARDALLDDIGMLVELIANGGADEVRAVRIEALVHHQVDLPEIDVAEVDGDLLKVTRLRSKLAHVGYHPDTIH